MNSSGAGQERKNKSKNTNFRQRVLSIIQKIPRGKVLTYGQVATIAGIPRAARMVGGVLFGQGSRSRIPWQRVINARGGLSTYRVGFGEKQKALLEGEGIHFNSAGLLDLKTYQWRPSPQLLKKFGIDDNLVASIKFGLSW
jgi:methylated-DNA-protein-cysteine methyltransferase related protein